MQELLSLILVVLYLVFIRLVLLFLLIGRSYILSFVPKGIML
jgi:hypothetical protein